MNVGSTSMSTTMTIAGSHALMTAATPPRPVAAGGR